MQQGRRRLSLFTRWYRRLKSRVKTAKRHGRKRLQNDGRLAKTDVGKWKLEAPFAEEDYLGCKWETSTRPHSERVPIEYECSCHGSNKKLSGKSLNSSEKESVVARCPEQKSGQAMNRNELQGNIDVHHSSKAHLPQDIQVQVHPQPGLSISKAPQLPMEKQASSISDTSASSRGNFSSKHSKHTRQYKEVTRSPRQKHPEGESCTCRLSAELSNKKDLKQKAKQQKKWEKEKKQWQRQASYKQRGRNYQVLGDDESSDIQNTPDYEKFERALGDEYDQFQLRRSFMKDGDSKKKYASRPMPRRIENVKDPGKGHIHEHGANSQCSCQLVVEFSRMMDKRDEEARQERLRKQMEEELPNQSNIQASPNETNTISVDSLPNAGMELLKSKLKTTKKKTKDVVRSISETSPTASPSKKLLPRSQSESSDIPVPEPSKPKTKTKLDSKPHTHNHENCSCKLVKEYSMQKDREDEERRRKLNAKPVMDNDLNAQKEQATKSSKGKTKSKGQNLLIRLLSADATYKECQHHGPCSCHAVKRELKQQQKQQQQKQPQEQQHQEQHKQQEQKQRPALLRSQSEQVSNGHRNHPAERPNSTPGGFIDKTLPCNDSGEKVFHIRIYKGYRKSHSMVETSVQNGLSKEVDPAKVWLHPDDWVPVKTADIPNAFDLVDWDQAVSPPLPPTTTTHRTKCTVPGSSLTVPYDEERWSPLKTPPKNKARAHVHTLNLSEWSSSSGHPNTNTDFSKTPEEQDCINPAISLPPEGWTLVKEVDPLEISTEVPTTLIADPSQWTPVKTNAHSSSDVPHKAAGIYNQYAAQFQPSNTVYLPVEDWDPRKEEPLMNHSREYYTCEHSTGYLPVEQWEPEKKEQSADAAVTSGVLGHLELEKTHDATAGIPVQYYSTNPFLLDSFVPVPTSHIYANIPKVESTENSTFHQISTSTNPFTSSPVQQVSLAPPCGRPEDLALSPNDSGCFSIGSPLSDPGKQFVSSSIGVQCDLIPASFQPLNQSQTPQASLHRTENQINKQVAAEPVTQILGQTVNQTTEQPVNQAAVAQPINKETSQPLRPSAMQPVNPTATESVNQEATQSVTQDDTQPVSMKSAQRLNQSTSQPVNLQQSQLQHHPLNHCINQSSPHPDIDHQPGLQTHEPQESESYLENDENAINELVLDRKEEKNTKSQKSIVGRLLGKKEKYEPFIDHNAKTYETQEEEPETRSKVRNGKKVGTSSDGETFE